VRVLCVDVGCELVHVVRLQVSFLDSVAPTRALRSKSLISSDTHTGKGRYKFTYAVEVLPICKDDLVYLPTKTANILGHIERLCVCSKVSKVLHIHDPTSLQVQELQASAYWKTPFKPALSREHLQEFVVLNIELERDYLHTAKTPRLGKGSSGRSKDDGDRNPRTSHRKTMLGLAEITVARRADFGVNDRTERALTSLGNVLRVGDYVWGYMVAAAAFGADLDPEARARLPEVVLVKKSYSERRKKTRRWRIWKLQSLQKEDEPGVQRGREIDAGKYEADYENFMQELEENPALRSQINLYRDPQGLDFQQKWAQRAVTTSASETPDLDGDFEDDRFPDVGLEELLEELSLGADESDIVSFNMLPTQHESPPAATSAIAPVPQFGLPLSHEDGEVKFNFVL